jgi:hypothetical protein
VTFDPHSLAAPFQTGVDGTSQLNAVACRTPTDCVAVDTVGQAVEGDPRGVGAWSVGQIAAGSSLAGLACPSALECVAVDPGGDAFVGSSGPLPPVPARISPPTISGTTKRGHTLSESRGSWSNGPTSFVYQWERCDAAGGTCAAIPGATGQTYLLALRDVGHKLRVSESASNITGTGTPSASAATALVRGLVPVAASHLSLSGVSRRKPKLAFTLTAGPGERPLKAVAVSLPSVVSVLATGLRHGIVVAVRGRKIRFSARARGRELTITLRRPAATVRITIGDELIAASKAVARRVRAHKLRTVTLVVITTETGGTRTRLQAKVRAI